MNSFILDDEGIWFLSNPTTLQFFSIKYSIKSPWLQPISRTDEFSLIFLKKPSEY